MELIIAAVFQAPENLKKNSGNPAGSAIFLHKYHFYKMV